MPQLPSFQDLGQAVPQPAQQPLVNPAIGESIGAAQEQFGHTTEQLGEKITTNQHYQGMVESRFAQANVVGQMEALKQSALTDPDYKTVGQRTQQQISGLIDNEAKNISDPYARNMFVANMTKTLSGPY